MSSLISEGISLTLAKVVSFPGLEMQCVWYNTQYQYSVAEHVY